MPAATTARDAIPSVATDDTGLRPVVEATPPPPSQPASVPLPRGGSSAPSPPIPVADQVVAQVQQHRAGTIEITLEPEELGRLHLTIRPRDDGVALVVQADRPETLDLVRRHGAELGRALQQAGYASVDLSFGGSAARSQPGSAMPDPSESAPDASPSDTAPPPGRPPLRLAGALDIRL
ncbi:flagellar hook-length control protein FliK [Pseudooceanicola sp. LIPI14-2-Ac024]|uniref:flagellar hook-length control protein FliK n=1 Tax=Pseudooceanicola sp. LIPI14-2-Ac024 TaxID=3344875 RepID=UPI0035CEA2EC